MRVREAAGITALLALTFATASCGGDDGTLSTSVPTATSTPQPLADIVGGGLFVVSADGTDLRRIAGGLPDELYFGPAWSPDGGRIAFNRAINQTSELWIVNIDSAEMTPLTSNGRSNYLPAWSPDGTTLVYISQMGAESSQAELYRIDVSGTSELRLTNDDDWDYSATWTRDGREIIFGSEQDDGWHIYRMSATGEGRQLLAVDAAGNAPSLSPDGRRIVFTSDRDGDDDIYIMAADGSSQQNLATNESHDDNASWSPDGSRIVFTSDRSGNNEIYTMAADGTDVQRITQTEGSEWTYPLTPSWSPNGDYIAFSAFPEG